MADIDGKDLHEGVQKGLPADIESLIKEEENGKDIIKRDKSIGLPISDNEPIRRPNEEGEASCQDKGLLRVLLGALMAFSMVCLGIVGYRGRVASLRRVTRQPQGR